MAPSIHLKSDYQHKLIGKEFMIDVFSWPTPNGHKIHIMLEECELPYRAIPVNIGAGEQFKPEFLRISPNNKIPAIVDPHGPDGKPISMFESGAILLYLASKTGRFMPESVRAKYEVLQWLMFQMGAVGPLLGQTHHFRLYAPEKIEYAVDRYTNEAKRIYNVLDARLEQSPWLGGDDYSIADIATFPWARRWERQGLLLSDYPRVERWFNTISARPAVQRGVNVLADLQRPITDAKARENLFGKTQYQRH
jgi:GSH-dependent disulfide-bond oxidoreductase